MSTEALVFDALRTPRGKGKSNGSLHSTKPVDLVVGLMHEMLAPQRRPRSRRASTTSCSAASRRWATRAPTSPRPPRIKAGLPDTVAGVQLNRFCASGLEAVNVAAQKVASGWEDLVFAGGVESMSRVPMGTDGGAWAMDPETAYDTSFVPQGISADLIATVEGFTREDVDAYAVRSQERAAAARDAGPLRRLGRARSCDINDQVVLDQRRVHPPGHHGRDARRPEAVVRGDRRHGRLRRRRAAEVPLGREDRPRPHAGQLVAASSTAPRWWPSATSRPARSWASSRAPASWPRRCRAPTRRSCSPAPRPRPRRRWPRPASRVDDLDLVEINEAFAAVVAALRARHGPGHGEGQRQRRRDRHGPPAGRDRGDDPRHARRRAAPHRRPLRPVPRCAWAAAWASRRSWRRSDMARLHQHDPLGPGRGRHRRPHARRSQPVGQHDERRLRPVDGRRRSSAWRPRRTTSRASSSRRPRRRSSPAATSTTSSG